MAANTGHLATATAVVTSNQTTTGQSAANITGLALTIGANETWTYVVHMKIGSSSVTGTQYAVNFPSGATVTADWVANVLTNAASAYEQTTAAATLTATSFNTLSATTAAVGAFCDAIITVINGATPGTVQIQHAKTTSGTATCYAGATLVGTQNA